ncbi:MAG: CHASE domain-containing protein [Synechococcus sp.]|nr:CHASE domain-containing protein [Synechococcus sp.]
MRWLPWGVLILGLVLTGAAAEQRRRRGIEDHTRAEQLLLQDVREAIRRRLDVNRALLWSVVALYNSSREVDADEFSTFSRTIGSAEGNLRGIQGLGFARLVPTGEEQTFVAAMRDQGMRDFRVFPQGPRPVVTAIQYLQPLDWRNRLAIGYDMFSQPTRREAMERAALTGLPAMSGKVKLLQDPGQRPQAGTLLYLPVWKAGSPQRNSTPEESEDLLSGAGESAAKLATVLPDLFGWAYSPLRIGDLMRASLESIRNPDLARATVVLYDGTAPEQERQLFRGRGIDAGSDPDGPDPDGSDPDPGQQGLAPLSHASYQTMDVGGRAWLVGVSSGLSPAGLWGFTRAFWLTVALGTASSLLLALMVRVLVRDQILILRELEISQNLNRERALAATVFEQTPYGVSVTDSQARLLRCNEAFCRITGYTTAELEGRNLSLLKSGRHPVEFYRQMWEQIQQRGHWEGELWNRVHSGEVKRHELTIQAVQNEVGELIHYVGMLHDVSHRYQQEAEILFQARHDYLTGLANRAELVEQMDQSLAQARRYGQRVALLFLDLDGFKPINDELGHATGDKVLQVVARRLQEVVRESDTLCRQGGDEFVLLIPQAGDNEALRSLAVKLREKVEEPIEELGPLRLSVSIGIAVYPVHAASGAELLHQADTAMYCAKQARQAHQGEIAMAMAAATVQAPTAAS